MLDKPSIIELDLIKSSQFRAFPSRIRIARELGLLTYIPNCILVNSNGVTDHIHFVYMCDCVNAQSILFVYNETLKFVVVWLSGQKVPSKTSLQALLEHYRIPLIGQAHRALSDVHSLALVLQRLTYDLKMPISGLIQGSFK